MLIYDALKKDHDGLKPLLDELIEAAHADKETREKIIGKVRDELIPHSRAEEAVFYNSLRMIDGCKELVAHGYGEHMEAETILRTLQTMEFIHADWTKLAKELKKGILHHISEEEGEIFTAAKQVLAVEEAQMMGKAFESLKPKYAEETFMETTMELVANLMPKRFIAPLRSFMHKGN